MKHSFLVLFFFLLSFSVCFSESASVDHECPAPMGVMGDHGHQIGEMMFSYHLMAMNMRGLQSGTGAVETVDVLKDFMMAPTAMDLRMHMFGVMFALHDNLTLMAMTSYQQRYMEMEGAPIHAAGHPNHPISIHKMSSTGVGDVLLVSLLPLWRRDHFTLLCNVGVSFPTGSITQSAEDGSLLPYPMQLGSGSFEVRPGMTFSAKHVNWSYGSQLRVTFPLHTNAGEYRHGHTFTLATWGVRQLNEWFSLSGLLQFSHIGHILGSYVGLNPMMSPSHRSDFSGVNRADVAISSNLIVPRGVLSGQRFALELLLPIYQYIPGVHLKKSWQLTLGWQYTFRLR